MGSERDWALAAIREAMNALRGILHWLAWGLGQILRELLTPPEGRSPFEGVRSNSSAGRR